MSVSVQANESQKTLTIHIMGSFDFSLFNEFRAAYSDYAGKYDEYFVDMSQVEYLDSAALGMLLSMRNAVGEQSKIELIGANSFIKDILMISRFDKLFSIK
ncbi:STAS domain-containing protein [Marinomonas dokdonensis]|uniref:STAS domain-containing protein n=1 Tax=Marinomonas dokdonensis TaxID=328224 RepID=UPI00405562FC